MLLLVQKILRKTTAIQNAAGRATARDTAAKKAAKKGTANKSDTIRTLHQPIFSI